MAKRTVTITKVFVNYESKDGKKYKSPLVNIYFNGADGSQQKASSFVANDSPALQWQSGDTLELEFTKDGDYINFKAPKAVDELIKRIEALEKAVFTNKAVATAKEVLGVTETVMAKKEVINPDDLPF